jgi:hypothetical protein
MTQPTKAFVLTNEIVEFLEERAAAEDRSVSWIVRQILEKEMARQKEGVTNGVVDKA